jgi:hypothetical protein
LIYFPPFWYVLPRKIWQPWQKMVPLSHVVIPAPVIHLLHHSF